MSLNIYGEEGKPFVEAPTMTRTTLNFMETRVDVGALSGDKVHMCQKQVDKIVSEWMDDVESWGWGNNINFKVVWDFGGH